MKKLTSKAVVHHWKMVHTSFSEGENGNYGTNQHFPAIYFQTVANIPFLSYARFYLIMIITPQERRCRIVKVSYLRRI